MRFSRGGHHRGAAIGRAVTAVALVVPVAGVVGATPAYAVVPPCGSTITQDTVLTGDMTCPGDGLFIGASNVTLNLNGHMITGPGPNVRPSPDQIYSGVNILFGRSGVTVTNGTILGFTIGMTTQVGANGNEISHLTLTSNGQGILTQFNPTTGASSDDNYIHDNTIEGSTGANGPAVWLQGNRHNFASNIVRNNQNSGVALTADDNALTGNWILANTFLGIELRGGAASSADRNVVSNNTIRDNAATGIGVNGDGNQVAGNTMDNNRGNGINVGGPNSARRWLNNRIEGNSLTGTGRPDTMFPAIGLFAAESTVVASNRVIGIGRAPAIFASDNSRSTTISNNQASGNTDGIHVSPGATMTTISGNQTVENLDDGIDVNSPSTTLARNVAAYNGDLGIEAVPGVVDAGGNRAFGNGNPQQCSPTVVCA